MQFSVIYSFEIAPHLSVNYAYPSPAIKKIMELTEHHFSEFQEGEPLMIHERWKHRKLVGLFSREQFEMFLDDTGLYAQSIDTMGSLGAPGFGMGWAPAISFDYDDYDLMANAYVTPIPNVVREDGWTDRDFDRMKAAIVRMYGD